MLLQGNNIDVTAMFFELKFELICELKGLFHPGCLARVVSLFASVAAIFMAHEMATTKEKQ